MKHIQNKIQEIKQTGTRQAYENTIAYLKEIISMLLGLQKPRDIQPQTQIYKQPRSSSEDNKKIKRYIQNQVTKIKLNENIMNSQYIDEGIEKYQGSQISFIQNLNKRMKQNMQIKPKAYKLNRRGLQQTVEIYHQCLQKSIQFIKYIFVNAYGIENKERHWEKILKKLQDFWGKYCKAKKQSKTFDDLIQVSHNILAYQFLAVLYPLKKLSNPNYIQPLVLNVGK